MFQSSIDPKADRYDQNRKSYAVNEFVPIFDRC